MYVSNSQTSLGTGKGIIMNTKSTFELPLGKGAVNQVTDGKEPEPKEEPKEADNISYDGDEEAIIEDAWLVINEEGKGAWLNERFEMISPGAKKISSPVGRFVLAQEDIMITIHDCKKIRLAIFVPEII